MKNLNQSKGITLIALIITIIVLLILVGISISTLTGQNGILTKATTAKERTEIEDAKEQAKLDILAELSERITNGQNTDLNDSDIQNILTGREYVGTAGDTSFTTKKSGYKILYSDLYNSSTGNQPPIPEGFYHAGGTIEEGFVISDIPEDDLDNSKHGNQFVWVPVPNIDNFHTIKDYQSGELCSIDIYSEPYQEGDEEELSEYDAMKTRVEKNKGFYIGRYEAGNDGSDNVIVQKGVTPYTGKQLGTDIADMTGGASEKAKNFTNGKPYSGKVTSTLVYGVQWDATMQFMDSNYITGNCLEDSYVRNSVGKGWYEDNYKTGNPEFLTGVDVDDEKSNCVNNIYDMAGNVMELTMEACETTYNGIQRTYRGGDFSYGGFMRPASHRTDGTPWDNTCRHGFRIALYL